jgi:branched-chain amino acid transport system ATP-binding protein
MSPMTEAIVSRSPDDPLMKVSGLSRRFGGIVALDGLSFDLHAGEKLAVIGPNGAGKSTLLKLIAGQDAPSAGTIELAGEGVVSGHTARDLARRGVGLARQVPRPLRSLTVRQNISVGIRAGAARRTGSAGERIDEILALTGLTAKAERPAGQLPLLDLKRLEMARALACEPRVLLLDEVSAGLNETELDEAIELMAALHRSGATLILVEHVQRVVHQLADRVIVLNWGTLLAEGTPAEVTADPRVQQVYLGSGRPAAVARERSVTQDPSRPGLVVEQLTVRRGMHRALEQVSLRIGVGEIVTVLGANGAGKTTLTGAISGLLPNQSGRIEWAGEDVTPLAAHVRAQRGIAHCQEGRRLFAGLTVVENLELGGYGARPAERERRMQSIFELFPVLADRRTQIGATMSGGQQQMLAIGRALMSDPGLLMLDEVTLGLSPKVADEIYEAINRIAATDTSLLLVEQDTERCLSVADRAYVLSHGRVVFEGIPADLTQERLLSAYLGAGSTPHTTVDQPVDMIDTKKGKTS